MSKIRSQTQGGKGLKRKLKGRMIWPYLFILPFFIIYIAFNCYPLIYTFIISLNDWDGFSQPVSVGLANYKNIFTEDPYFLKSIGNTLFFMAFDIPIVIICGLILASVFNSRKLKGAGFFRTAVFLPYITIPVAIGVLFCLLFDWNSGTVNLILARLGLIEEHINFLGVPRLARMIVVMMICWKYIGYHMIFFNAGISGISMELYEAADVDGASELTFFFKILLPVCTPVIAVLVLWQFVAMWNSYFDAMIYLNDSARQPLQLVLRSILIQNQPESGMIADMQSTAARAQLAELLKYATIIISSLPLLIMYPFFQKYFDSGIMAGAVKG